MPKETAYPVPALEKGLDILECLAASQISMTQMDIARALGKGQSELFRMLNCLERRGYVSKDPVGGAYTLTLRLFELGHAHSPHQALLRAAQQPMRKLAEQVGESCHLSVLQRGALLVVAQEESMGLVRVSVEIGSRSPVLHTVSGRLLLAYLDENSREVLLNEQDSPPKGVALKALFAKLQAIRELGYEAADSERVVGLHDTAVLVGGAGSSFQAALAISALERKGARQSEPKLLKAMFECAAAINRAAGLTAGA